MRSLAITGRSGRLKSGSRVVTEIAGWEAQAVGGGRLRVAVTAHEPDPFWWEHHDPARLRLDLDFGREGLRGPAELLSSAPLTLIMTLPQEEA